jgi:hypothetical protein
MVINKSRDGQRTRRETHFEFGQGRECAARRHFVLDRDVRSPAVTVLLRKVAMEGVRKLGANIIEFVRDDAIRDSSPKVHQPADRCARRRAFGCKAGKATPKLILQHMWDGMEHRQMRIELVALGREVSSSKSIEYGLVGRAQMRGNDQGRIHDQIST